MSIGSTRRIRLPERPACLTDLIYKIPFSFLLIYTSAAVLSEADKFQMLPPRQPDRMTSDSVIAFGGGPCLVAGAEARTLSSLGCEKPAARRLASVRRALAPGSLNRAGPRGTVHLTQDRQSRLPDVCLLLFRPPRNNDWLQIADKSQIHEQLPAAAGCRLLLRVPHLSILFSYDLLATAASGRPVGADAPTINHAGISTTSTRRRAGLH